MRPLDAMNVYFPSGTAEGEREILKEVFIQPKQFEEIISSTPGNPCIIVGNKGIGKTAILERIYYVTQKSKLPSLLLQPSDLNSREIGTASDTATIVKIIYECLISTIASHIGMKLEGMLSGEALILYNEAVRTNNRPPDWLGKSLIFLSGIAKPAIKFDATEIAASLTGTKPPRTLIHAVESYLLSDKSNLTVMIDDTDQIASMDDPGHLNRIWGLLIAIRKLAQNCPNLKLLVTLRTEIWGRLQRENKGQRDQVDHIRPLIVDLIADDQYMSEIYNKRIHKAIKIANLPHSNVTTVFYETEEVRLPGSRETRSWSSFIRKSSRERPRDLVQLVNHFIKKAKAYEHERITSDDAEKAMIIYSKERLDDISIEFSDRCPRFAQVLNAFAESDFEQNFETLRTFLRRVPTRFSLTINGTTISPEDDDHMLIVLKLLHESGFINPRIPDHRNPKDYRHINFRDDPTLIQRARWNELQAAIWDIHPAFRSHLQKIKQDHLQSR